MAVLGLTIDDETTRLNAEWSRADPEPARQQLEKALQLSAGAEPLLTPLSSLQQPRMRPPSPILSMPAGSIIQYTAPESVSSHSLPDCDVTTPWQGRPPSHPNLRRKSGSNALRSSPRKVSPGASPRLEQMSIFSPQSLSSTRQNDVGPQVLAELIQSYSASNLPQQGTGESASLFEASAPATAASNASHSNMITTDSWTSFDSSLTTSNPEPVAARRASVSSDLCQNLRIEVTNAALNYQRAVEQLQNDRALGALEAQKAVLMAEAQRRQVEEEEAAAAAAVLDAKNVVLQLTGHPARAPAILSTLYPTNSEPSPRSCTQLPPRSGRSVGLSEVTPCICPASFGQSGV